MKGVRVTRAQLSLFLILGIILLLFIGIMTFIIMNGYLSEYAPRSMNREKINRYVTDCISTIGEESLITIGLNGGHLEVPAGQNYTVNHTIFQMYDTSSEIPTIEEVEQSLEQYMDSNLIACLNDFADFRRIGYQVSYGDVHTESSIFSKSISYTIVFPLTIQHKEVSISIKEFKVFLEGVRFMLVHSALADITRSNSRYPAEIDLTMLAGFDLNTTIIPLSNTTFFFDIADMESYVCGEPYHLRFILTS